MQPSISPSRSLGVGMGADPTDEKACLLNEGAPTPRSLKLMPTFVSVALDGQRDINTLAASLIAADSYMIAVYDKSKDKGAVIRF